MLNCGLRQRSFQSLPWEAHEGAEHTWHGRDRARHHSSAAALQGHRTDTGDGHGTTGKQGKTRKGQTGRAMEMKDCGHRVGTPTTPVIRHKAA